MHRSFVSAGRGRQHAHPVWLVWASITSRRLVLRASSRVILRAERAARESSRRLSIVPRPPSPDLPPASTVLVPDNESGRRDGEEQTAIDTFHPR